MPSDKPGPSDKEGKEQHGSVKPKEVDKKEKEMTTAEIGKVIYGVQSFGQ